MSISFARWVAEEDCIICCMRRAAWPPAQHLHHVSKSCDPVGTGATGRLRSLTVLLQLLDQHREDWIAPKRSACLS